MSTQSDVQKKPRPAAPPLPMRPMRNDAADLALFRACFAKNSDRPRSAEALTWQYFENTTPHLFVDVAVAPDDAGGERLAAIYASLPGWMRIDGERRLVLQSLDTLTDADFRGQGLFVTLAKKTFARAAADGAALIYGFPNGNSAPGFFKKLEWLPLDPMPFLLRPLRLSYGAERLKLPEALRPLVPKMPLVAPFGRRRRAGVREITAIDPRLTLLWEKFAKGVGVAIDRDAAYLQWRLFDRPGGDYRTLISEDPKRDEIRAMCSFTVKDKHGGRIGYVMELMHDRTLAGLRAASHLLGLAIREMSDEGADSVLAWSLSHSASFPLYARHAFFPLPERFRPIELHFGVRAFDERVAATVNQRESWYMSYLDSDTV